MTSYAILEPQTFKLDGGAMFGIIPKPLWNKVHPADDENRIELALRLQLIKKEDKIILIDTGIGTYHGDKFDQRFAVTGNLSPLEASLKAVGLTTNDITDLVISHLHFDHVGGIAELKDGKLSPVLPKATLHLHRDHYQYSLNPTERDAGSFHQNVFEPIIKIYEEKNQVHWITGDSGEVLPGLNFIISHGHTPYLLHAHDDKFIYLADLIPTSNHVHIPWVMGYDISPGVTTVDKRRVLKFIQENNLTAIFEHDPKFFGSKIIKNQKNEFECGEKFSAKNESGYWIENP
jgi:glyoxylase-like metal-dependent hydrolase (beta-lactamase superfamily II)